VLYDLVNGPDFAKWWGSMPFDLLNNPKLTENTPAQLGSNAFECLQAERCTMFRSQKVPEI
jgi:hypothetical protein